MVTLLISTLALFAVIGIGLFFWRRSASETSENLLPLPPPPPPDARGLFFEDANFAQQEAKVTAREQADSLIRRAQNGERAALIEAHATHDPDLYQRVLDELVKLVDSDSQLLALVSYVAQNELPVSVELAQAMLAGWKRNPNRSSTAKALHFAALSDDADIYRSAVEDALILWREGRLNDSSAPELQALFDGEFWVLSSRSRSSGAGFVLKRTLAGARRELEAATSANQ